MPTIDDFIRPKEWVSDFVTSLGKVIRRWGEENYVPIRQEVDEDWREHKLIKPLLKEVLVDLGHAEPIKSTTATPTPANTTATSDPAGTGTGTATTGETGALTDQLAGVGVASALAGVGLGGWRYLRE